MTAGDGTTSAATSQVQITTLLRAPDNSVSGTDSRSTQLPMCASSGSTWLRALLSL